METKEEFVKRYCERQKLSTEEFWRRNVVMECTCEDDKPATHWAAVHNNPDAIAQHLDHERVLEYNRTH